MDINIRVEGMARNYAQLRYSLWLKDRQADGGAYAGDQRWKKKKRIENGDGVERQEERESRGG